MRPQWFAWLAAASLALAVAVAGLWARSCFYADASSRLALEVAPDGSSFRGAGRFASSRWGVCSLTWWRFEVRRPPDPDLRDPESVSRRAWYDRTLDDYVARRAEHDRYPSAWASRRVQPKLFQPLSSTRLGLNARWGDSGWYVGRAHHVDVTCPYWLPLLVSSALPALWLWATIRRARRPKEGLCPACGYDLRATPDRCPECGTAGAGMGGERRPSMGGGPR